MSVTYANPVLLLLYRVPGARAGAKYYKSGVRGGWRRTRGKAIKKRAENLQMDPSNFSRSLMSPQVVKTEAAEERGSRPRTPAAAAAGANGRAASASPAAFIDLSSSDSDSDGEGAGGSGKRARGAGGDGSAGKRARVSAAVDLPPGFLEPIPPPPPVASAACATKQFWKAGDYDGKPLGDGVLQPSGTTRC